MNPQEFGDFIQAELTRYTQLAKQQNIRLDE